MKENIIKVEPGNKYKSFTIALDIINKGGIIAYPTETFYALGCNPYDKNAVERLFRLKKRDQGKPVPVIAANIGQILKLTGLGRLPREIFKITEKFWPGPLSLVLPASKTLAPYFADTGVACRIPSDDFTLELVSYIALPLTSTSLNISGEPPASSVSTIPEELLGEIDLVLDNGDTPGPPPSTIIKISENGLELIREGRIPFDLIVSAFKE